MVTEQEKQSFIAVLKYFGMFQPITNYKVICPFHADKNPSLLIDLENANWFCFGCDLHGRAMELVTNFFPKLSSMEAMVKMTEIVRSGSDGKRVPIEVAKVKTLNMQAVRDYYFNLPKVNWNKVNDEARVYMRKRGFRMKTLNEADARINTDERYKVVFPIYDNGVFRGYVGRTTDAEVEKQRKYIYNTGFRRAKTLAGTYMKETVLVVEGFLDMLKAKQCGVTQVVAVLGWKMSDQQRQKLLHRGVKTIICGLDNDKSGRRGYAYLVGLKEFNVIRLRYPKSVKDFGDVTDEIFQNRIRAQVEKYNLLED
jgi:DNA primase